MRSQKVYKNYPVQYKRGYCEFYKLKFKVTPDVLIPRPETELLVDEVLAYAKQSKHPHPLTILDVGTGSGNIAISLAKNFTHHLADTDLAGPTHPTYEVLVIATDISQKALKVAKQNAKLHGVQDKIAFVQSNLLNIIRTDRLPRDAPVWYIPRNDNLIIVTNLPYIPSARIPYLDSSVKDFEPLVALDGGRDGFAVYRKLFQQIKGAPLGWKPKFLIGEIDYTHKDLAVNEAMKFFPDAQIEVKTDLAYKQRILKITFP